MEEKLEDSKINAVWKAVEKNLGIPSEHVAVSVFEDGRIEADCMILEKIPEHTLEKMKEGDAYKADGEKFYIKATDVVEPQQLELTASKVE